MTNTISPTSDTFTFPNGYEQIPSSTVETPSVETGAEYLTGTGETVSPDIAQQVVNDAEQVVAAAYANSPESRAAAEAYRAEQLALQQGAVDRARAYSIGLEDMREAALKRERFGLAA